MIMLILVPTSVLVMMVRDLGRVEVVLGDEGGGTHPSRGTLLRTSLLAKHPCVATHNPIAATN